MSKPLPDLNRVDRMILDLDIRLSDLWAEAAKLEEWDLELAMAYARAAYGRGYTDALKSADPEELFREHGYRVPERRKH